MKRWFFLLGTSLFFTGPLQAAEKPESKGVEFFESKIRPVLAKQCYECHSAKSSKLKGNLLVDTRSGLLTGGDSGPALVPGKPEESLLVKSLKHDGLIMPPKTKLPDQVVEDFVKWIAMGAPDPRDGAVPKAYRTLTLEESKDFWSFKPPVKQAPPAVKAGNWAKTEIDQFILAKMEEKNLRPVADAAVTSLLRRLHFDLVGLPPSPQEVDAFVQGMKDNPKQTYEKTVDALLASKHFGERWGRHWLDIARYAETNGNTVNVSFPEAYRYRDYVIQSYNADKPYDQFIREQVAGDLLPASSPQQKDDFLVATGFLALTSKPTAQANPDYKFDILADQVDVTTRSLMGLSVMCARCHDHKFDPISTKEYYSLAGIFDSTRMLYSTSAGKGNGKKGAMTDNSQKLSDGGEFMGALEGKPGNMNVRVRGESKDLGEVAPRGFLKAVSISDAPEINKNQSGRLELAQYLSSRSNSFTSRIAVNRVWQHLFGQGLVRTPDNFGNLGEKPSHPDLLDYLAIRFVENGWSTKKLIKELVMTRTYQMGSSHDDENYKIDPDNAFLWRMPIRRLEAEAIRDSMLAISGQLNPEPMKGSLVGTLKGAQAIVGAKETNHRSVYQAMPRSQLLPEVLSVFDIANPNLVVAQREVTTVPAQALFLMNSPFIREQSKHFAGRLLGQKDLSDEARIDLAFKMAFGRGAQAEERQKALAFLTQSGKDASSWQMFCQTLFASAEFRYLD